MKKENFYIREFLAILRIEAIKTVEHGLDNLIIVRKIRNFK
ncbi:hypothetical protein Mgra_00007895 [Meloidogyne graminicola]|uniref:Uncharacterized protein n=1 Tax=Meloidogyne graminicola TaxID=189291 RepID=A0A8S9ZH57_9BILA|nr:hypothetical protein Mgra_00007895 [Meloidogyne graminicola]